jgi:PAS domain S-box-containing protein
MFGYAPEEIIGRPVSILFTPDHNDELKFILEKMRKKESIVHHETKRVRRDGTQVKVSLTISPVKGVDDYITGTAVTARQINHKNG